MNNKFLLIIVVVSIITHFAFFGRPNEVVFDEVFFGKFVSYYYNHHYYFDIHPPLGKLIISGFSRLFGSWSEFNFSKITDEYPDERHYILRFLPTLAGALLPIVIYFIALQIGLKQVSAFIASLLIAIDNALIVQSRFILMDSFLLLFGFLSFLFYLKYFKDKSVKNMALAGIFAGFAVSIKWTALAFLGIICIIEIYRFIKRSTKIGNSILWFVVIPFIIYFSFFAVHFSLLNKSSIEDNNKIDNIKEMLDKYGYEYDLSGNKKNIISKFFKLNAEMYVLNKDMIETDLDYNSSKWYEWPFMILPMTFWDKNSSGIYQQVVISLVGNIVIWWGSTIAIFLLIYELIKGLKKYNDFYILLLLGGYLINFLPFIAIRRPMYLYHYFPAYIFAILIMVILIERSRESKYIFRILVFFAIVAFLFLSPVTY